VGRPSCDVRLKQNLDGLNLMLITLELKLVFKLTLLMSYEHFYVQGKIVFDLEYSRISNRMYNLVLGIKSLFTSQIKSLSLNSSRLNKIR